MSDDNEAVDWRKLREFAGVDLSGSFVLSWEFEAGALLIDSDVLLRPEHPFYEQPRPAEKVCIRPAVIEFPFCTDVAANGVNGGDDLKAFVGKLGHGAIEGLQRRPGGRYEIRGGFGTIVVEAERPVLRLKGP